MPQRDRAPDVIRIVEGLTGEVAMRGELALRFDYGSVVPWMRRTDGHRVAIAGPDSVWLRSVPPLMRANSVLSGVWIRRRSTCRAAAATLLRAT